MYIDFSGEYKLEELYDIGPIVSISRPTPHFLNADNCRVVNKKLTDDRVVLHLEAQDFDLEGTCEVKIKPQFTSRKDLLNKFFSSKEITGHALNELRNVKIIIN